MYVFGGFNSLLLSDVLTYTSPSCSAFSTQASCIQAWPGIHCVWNSTQGSCLPWESNTIGTEQQQLPPSCNTRSCRWRCHCIEILHLYTSAIWKRYDAVRVLLFFWSVCRTHLHSQHWCQTRCILCQKELVCHGLPTQSCTSKSKNGKKCVTVVCGLKCRRRGLHASLETNQMLSFLCVCDYVLKLNQLLSWSV